MRMMTTPLFTFNNLSMDPRELASVEMSFAQLELSKKAILIKEDKQLTLTKDSVSVQLTQEETTLFNPDAKLYVQLRGLTKGGQIVITDTFCTDVKRSLSDRVLTIKEG